MNWMLMASFLKFPRFHKSLINTDPEWAAGRWSTPESKLTRWPHPVPGTCGLRRRSRTPGPRVSSLRGGICSRKCTASPGTPRPKPRTGSSSSRGATQNSGSQFWWLEVVGECWWWFKMFMSWLMSNWWSVMVNDDCWKTVDYFYYHQALLTILVGDVKTWWIMVNCA